MLIKQKRIITIKNNKDMKNTEKTLTEKRNDNLVTLSENFATDKNLLSFNRMIKEEATTLKGACQNSIDARVWKYTCQYFNEFFIKK